MAETRTLKVLYMEDDAGLARLFQKRISRFGFEVTTAENGTDGLNLFKEDNFDVLVIDYQMPGRNGLQVLDNLVDRKPMPPVIMLTGAGNEEIAVDAMKMGASDYLTKDVNGHYFQLLPIVMREAIRRSKMAEEQRRMQLELKKYASELERSNRELQQFAYVVSHDLKEPLHTIRGFAQFIEETYTEALDDQANEFLGYIVDGTRRMERLIEGLLDYSRVKFEDVEMDDVNCEDLVNNVVQDLQATIEKRNADITHDSLPKIRGHERLLMRLFQNLIDNGMKYSSEEKPKVHISAEQENGHWKFSVKDNGIGIDPRHSERIFVIFQRLHNRNEFSGDGLGLAICKKIVESHSGKIWVESADNQGSTFFFTIPNRKSVSKS